MKIETLKNFATKKVIRDIEKDPFFKQRSIKLLFFLIDKYKFDKIETENFGKGSILEFKQKGNDYPYLIVEYEMGTLPNMQIFLSKNEKKVFSEDDHLINYPVHYEIQKVVKKEIDSIDNYIKELGHIWEKRYDEISAEVERCLESLANQAKLFFTSYPK